MSIKQTEILAIDADYSGFLESLDEARVPIELGEAYERGNDVDTSMFVCCSLGLLDGGKTIKVCTWNTQQKSPRSPHRPWFGWVLPVLLL